MIKKLLFFILIGFLTYKAILFGFDRLKPDYWMGVYYPYEDDWIYSDRLKTKEECIIWAKSIRVDRPQDAKVDSGYLWECNKNCELADFYKHLLEHSPNSVKDRDPIYVCDDDGGFDDADISWSN